MARVTAEIKRGALRSIFRQAQVANPAITLSSALDALQDDAWEAVGGGRMVTAHSGAGKTTQFALPQIWQSFTQDEFFSLTEELHAVYGDALVTLSGQGTVAPTDGQVFNVMMADDRLQTITSSEKDFSTMRWPTRL